MIFVKDNNSWHVQTKATVRKVRKLAAGVWVIDRCQTLLKPGGVSGYANVTWKPVTEEVSKFYNSEVVKGSDMQHTMQSRMHAEANQNLLRLHDKT